MYYRFIRTALIAATLAGVWQCGSADAVEGHWKRGISYQSKNDLFYNYQVGPSPSGTAAQMYVSPLPVPAHVGHTYTTYQPLMPHEMLYKHTRSHYAYQQGAGWSRSKVRYRTHGLTLQHMLHHLSARY
jgi:hypothetical protein